MGAAPEFKAAHRAASMLPNFPIEYQLPRCVLTGTDGWTRVSLTELRRRLRGARTLCTGILDNSKRFNFNHHSWPSQILDGDERTGWVIALGEKLLSHLSEWGAILVLDEDRHLHDIIRRSAVRLQSLSELTEDVLDLGWGIVGDIVAFGIFRSTLAR